MDNAHQRGDRQDDVHCRMMMILIMILRAMIMIYNVQHAGDDQDDADDADIDDDDDNDKDEEVGDECEDAGLSAKMEVARWNLHSTTFVHPDDAAVVYNDQKLMVGNSSKFTLLYLNNEWLLLKGLTSFQFHYLNKS